MPSTRFPVAVLSAVILAACAESGVGPAADTAIEPPDRPVTSVLLTDAPFPYDQVSRADIYVVSIQGAENADTGVTQADLVTLVAPRQRFDLLSLQGGVTAFLGDTILPAIQLLSVRVTINVDSSSLTLKDGTVLTGASSPGIEWQGTGEKPINAVVHQPVEISDTGAVVVVDFDIGQSFYPTGADSTGGSTGFVFIPWVRAVNSSKSGLISGRVVAAKDGVPIANSAVQAFQGNPDWPENTWSSLTSAKTNANGEFTLAYLWPRTYIVGVDPPSGSAFDPVRVRNVVVAAGDEIALGEIALARR